jgi:hypothetical protein
MLQEYLQNRTSAGATRWGTHLHRLRFTPRLVIQVNCTLDRIRDHALRRAAHADRRAQEPHMRRGGAGHRTDHTELTLNSNLRLSAKEAQLTMRSSDAFPSKFLKSADVKAKPLIAVISYLAFESVGQDKKQKPVLFLETSKPMVVNRTNFEELEAAFGDSDEWPGQKVKIFCAPTTFGGKRVDGIRVEAIVPKPTLKDELNDEAPL